ncbi:MAG TPA: DcaP family trimeric outer membrane transporter [Rhizomicrobium sp.]|nr:DcaP family trimeric outer membrane transporter [Rhizomicrobium sp.]
MKRAQLILCLPAIAGFAATAGPAHADTATSMQIYGFGEADYIYDSKRLDPNWESAFRPSKIATPDGEFGSDGQSDVSVKQSRFGVSGSHPTDTDFGDVSFKFEFDLFGVGADEGQTTFRLRHAYGEWGPLLAGQTNSVFMDINVFPNVIDYWGPAGMVFLRTPQLRYTPYRTEHSHFAFAIERPSNDIDPGTIRELDPDLGNNIENDEKMPDFTMHYYTSDSWGHAQLAGILRRVGYDTLGTADNEPKGAQLGWGVNASGHLNVFDKDKLIAQVVHGDGIASYMNDGGVDLSAKGIPGAIEPEAVPLTGVVAYYDRTWNDSFTSSLGYSFTRVDNANLQEPSAFHEGQYASVNLLWTPTKDILIGGELLWGKRTNFDGATGDDVRFQFSVKYSWGKSFDI